MLKLYSKQIKTLTANSISEPLVVRLSSNHLLPIGLRRNDFFLITQSNIDKVPSGFKGYFIPEDQRIPGLHREQRRTGNGSIEGPHQRAGKEGRAGTLELS